MPLDERLTMLKQDPNINEDDIAEYKNTEIVRRSVTDVLLRANVDKKRRESPHKTYSGVKSKVAGNMKS